MGAIMSANVVKKTAIPKVSLSEQLNNGGSSLHDIKKNRRRGAIWLCWPMR
jgi:hypothetical protein